MDKISENTGFVILDIDGVMTSTYETPGSYLTHDNDEYGISNGPFINLVKLLKLTKSKVIVSSNWRRFDDNGPGSFWHTRTRGAFKNHLPDLRRMLGELYVGDLPKIRHISKSEALRIWFKESGFDSKTIRYVIFDDDSREGFAESEFGEHYIQTDPVTGLTTDDCSKAEKILGI